MSNPESIYTSDNKVIAWNEATPEQRQEHWISIGMIKLFKKKRGPDKGHGKNNRKKGRGGRF